MTDIFHRLPSHSAAGCVTSQTCREIWKVGFYIQYICWTLTLTGLIPGDRKTVKTKGSWRSTWLDLFDWRIHGTILWNDSVARLPLSHESTAPWMRGLDDESLEDCQVPETKGYSYWRIAWSFSTFAVPSGLWKPTTNTTDCQVES